MTVAPYEPPVELAPQLRAAVERLLSECDLAVHPKPRRGPDLRPTCVVCHQKTGRMGGHHVVPGDDSSVVPVHRSCHRKLHPKAKAS